MLIDLGDATLVVNLRIKGLCRLGRPIFHIGTPYDTTPADRVVKGPPYATHTERLDAIMDLKADQQVPLSIQFTDEIGNPVAAPADAVVVWTVDDPTVINLTDNGDGTATAAAVGPLGNAVVHVEVTSGERVITGDLGISVVAGDAERIEIVAGTPTEVTPDV